MAGNTNSSPSLPTSSRCLTHGITATHDFKVSNFSLLVGIGTSVDSSTFSAGGCDWSIRFYPDGGGCRLHTTAEPDAEAAAAEAAASFTAVYLCLVAAPAGAGAARVKYKFTLLGDQGRRQLTRSGKRMSRKRKRRDTTTDLTGITETTTYGRVGQAWGTARFFDRSLLLEGLLRDSDSDDSFTIRCAMAVIRTRTEDDAVVEVPESALRHDLARMLRDGDGADVTFAVGGRSFRAHRCVLAARSMVFRAQLFGAMKEAAQGGGGVIRVDDDVDPGAFEGLLHYIYTDSLADDDGGCTAGAGGRVAAVQHLLVAADRYGLDRLRVLCEARLCGWIDVQSVATTLALAERHQQCAKLREACLRFLSWPDMLRAAMKTEGFGHLMASYPSVASDILDKVVSARID